jgi:serine protease
MTRHVAAAHEFMSALERGCGGRTKRGLHDAISRPAPRHHLVSWRESFEHRLARWAMVLVADTSRHSDCLEHNMLTRFFVLLLLCIALASRAAEYTPPRPSPLAPAAALKVIVKFKANAQVVRAHALRATASRETAAAVLGERARTLGARIGIELAGGAAVAERTQVVIVRGATLDEALQRLAADADVEYAEADSRMRRRDTPNDTLFAQGGSSGPSVGQWALKVPTAAEPAAADMVGAWSVTKGSADVVVAVLDTGARFDHPDLDGKLLAGHDMVSDTAISNDGDARDADAADPGDWVTAAEAASATFTGCDAADSSWHGTQVAGIVGAATNNALGMAGAGWNVKVLPVRVLGKCYGDSSDIIAAMRWAAGLAVDGVPANPNPAKVLNLSLGGDGTCSRSYQDAITEVIAAGAAVVVAAGNSAGKAVSAPANCNGVIAVAALRHVGTKVGYSDVGTEIAVAAPGGNCVNTGVGESCLYPIVATTNSGTRGPEQAGYSDSVNISVGTSFAAPLVAATAALVASAAPSKSPAEIRSAITGSARAFPTTGGTDSAVAACHAPDAREQLECYCNTSTCGAGMLDARAAVSGVAAPIVAISVSPASPQAGQTVTLSGADSTVAGGRTIRSHAWSLLSGGGIVTALNGALDAVTMTATPSAAGTFTVRLTVTDDTGAASSADQNVAVAASDDGGTSQASGESSSGGGAMAPAWLLLLPAAALWLHRTRAA